MKITRTWAMPNKNTFLIKPIYELLKEKLKNGMYGIDPFVGQNNPIMMQHFRGITLISNDLNDTIAANCHLDALEFLKKECLIELYDFVLFDPPYSPRQIKECYESVGLTTKNGELTKSTFYSNLKDEIARIVKPGGFVISCGWNSGGIGKNRGFEIKEILLVAHGGWHNDTIVTFERKVEPYLKKVFK